MKTLKQIHAERIATNLYKEGLEGSELAIRRLQSDFEYGKIRPAAARKQAANIIAKWTTALKRYNKLELVAIGEDEEKKEDLKSYIECKRYVIKNFIYYFNLEDTANN